MCGIIGAFSSRGAHLLEEIYLGLYALQHRGQEAAGVAWSDEAGQVLCRRGNGLVHLALSQTELAQVTSQAAIGHVRYATTGGTGLANAQPLAASSSVHGSFAVAHNGNLTNTDELKRQMEHGGAIFQSRTDTEVVLHLISHQPDVPFADAVQRSCTKLRGAFSLVIVHENRLIAVRDPWGFRPLALGERDGVFYVASESCAFDLLGAHFIRDLDPGEILLIDSTGLHSSKLPLTPARHYHCAFEYVYFARPDSVIDGVSVYESRIRMGRELAKTNGCPTDAVVTGLPDSGTIAALGYAAESGHAYQAAIVRNRYSGRTFIEPTPRVRELGVQKKLNPIRSLIEGRQLVAIDDSVVRGTTSRKVCALLRRCGARGIHLRISSPPVCYPCFYGIDTPSRDDLVAAQKSVPAMASQFGCDSLQYLTKEALIRSIGKPACELCTACFDGHYMEEDKR